MAVQYSPSMPPQASSQEAQKALQYTYQELLRISASFDVTETITSGTIAYKDEGILLANSNAVTSIDFTGTGVTASYAAGVVTVNVAAGGGGGIPEAPNDGNDYVRNSAGWVLFNWGVLDGKPATFTPSAHTHAAADTTSGTFDIARIPTGTTGTTVALGDHLHTGVYATAGHNHSGVYEPVDATILRDADIGVDVAAFGHNHTGVYAPVSHTHVIADTTGLQAALDGKSATGHTHAASDVTSGTFDIARIPTGTTGTTAALGDHLHGGVYAPVSHTHAAADTTSGIFDIARIPTGTTGTTAALGNHNHSGVYEPADATILKDADIGVTVAALSHTHAAADTTSGTFDIARIPTGTTGTTAALGNHTHAQLHDQAHAITSTADHTAGNWKVFYSNGSGQVIELALGAANTVLTSNGVSAIPSFATPAGGVSDGDKGDISVTGSGATWTIDNDVVTYAKMQNVSATDKLLGRSTAGAGDVEEIACTAAGRALLDDADAAAQRTTLGLGALALQGDGDKGDISVSGTGATWTVDNDAITYAKMQNISATQRVLGRNTAAAGDTEEVTFSQFLDWVGSAAQGDILYRGASSWTRLAAGTSGQLLQTNGASANPSWVTPAAGSSAWTTVKKTSDEARASNTTLTVDGALKVTLGVGVHVIRMVAFFKTANATMDYKYDTNFTGTTTWISSYRRHAAAGAAAGTDAENTLAAEATVPSTSVAATTTGIARVEIEATLNVTVSGDFQFRWAQATSDAGNLTARRGSYLEYMTL